jgi:hypothetical protein
MEKHCGKGVKKLLLVFVASQHQFAPANYHRVCDQLSDTLTIVKSDKNFLLGGFSDLPLGTEGPSQSFIFSATRRAMMPLKEGRVATLCEPAYGPVFGA